MGSSPQVDLQTCVMCGQSLSKTGHILDCSDRCLQLFREWQELPVEGRMTPQEYFQKHSEKEAPDA